ncbi:MAG TPA: hypothetical protein VKP08_21670, partial [Anaerolineales bacterium]|nr:hypothetical protein [Anaerolineales bacterium]
PGSLNTMIFATKQKTSPGNLSLNFLALSQDPNVHPLLLASLGTTVAYVKTEYETTTVFTDDHAPIEWIVNDMVIRFVLTGGTQYLQ